MISPVASAVIEIQNGIEPISLSTEQKTKLRVVHGLLSRQSSVVISKSTDGGCLRGQADHRGPISDGKLWITFDDFGIQLRCLALTPHGCSEPDAII